MDSQLKNSNRKREHDENDSNEQNKRKKPEVPEVADPTTNFIDVNDDCLVHIFMHLSLRNLINIADTCKRFQASAQSAFSAKYRGKLIKFYAERSKRKQTIKLYESNVLVTKFTSCLKILRHFGIKISKLDISYYYLGQEKKATLAWYMNEFCADSLIDLKIDYASNGVTTNWTKPFLNTESVEPKRSDLGDLSAFFPSIRRLVIHDSYQCIKYIFPHLTDLEINDYPSIFGARKYITEMLRLNPNLSVFKTCFPCCAFDMMFMNTVSGYLQSIRLLDISCDDGFFNLFGVSIHLKSVNEFHINMSKLRTLTLPKIPFTFDQLERVKLTVFVFTINDNFRTFIRGNPSLEKLTVCAKSFPLNPNWFKQMKSDLAKVSPSLNVEFLLDINS